MKYSSAKNIGPFFTLVSLLLGTLLPGVSLANDCDERGFKILIQEKHLEYDEDNDSFSHHRIWRDFHEGTWSTALPEHGQVAVEKKPQETGDYSYSVVLSFLPDDEYDGLRLETSEPIKLSSEREVTRFGESTPIQVYHSDSDVSKHYERFLEKSPKGVLSYRVFRDDMLLCSKRMDIIGIIDN